MADRRLLGGIATLSVVGLLAASAVQTVAQDPPPLTHEEIAAALTAEGQTVGLKSWGFGGLDQEVFPARFRAHTEATYGVPVELVWDSSNAVLQQAEQAGVLPSSLGLDVIDQEEDKWPKTQELGWTEPIWAPEYANVLTNYQQVDPAYHTEDGRVVYQGFEWMGVLVRKDIVDPTAITSWVDFAKPELKGKIVLYGFDGDTRGPIILAGVVRDLLDQGIIQGEMWTQETFLEGLEWWKANIEPNVIRYVDTGEIRTMIQSGEAAVAVTWGAYVRELLGADWNLRDDVLAPVYLPGALPADRSYVSIAKDTPRPVTARVLVDWILGKDFQMVGWYKDPETGEELNRWDMTEGQFLGAYTGGIIPADRELIPEWARPYYPDDPTAYLLPLDFTFMGAQTPWISDQYSQLP